MTYSSITKILLSKQNKHRSALIGRTKNENMISSFCHSMPKPNPVIVPILEQLGFAGVVKLRHLKVDQALVTTLVERWRPKTHTFHFSTGECTITLEDVALQLELKVDGLLIIGPTMFDWKDVCDTYIGIVPVKGETLIGSMMKLKWLRDNMLSLLDEPSEEQVHAHVMAYILALIRGVLMPDKIGNKVHLMYLALLTNLKRTRRYSWGSAYLAML
ncbi:protein MAIN-LIKE 2-like [Abrus precatorius]|uniref:Protein MAIN-LIKE 2-like n=1 Tax=Abrus precatorius TaxID=3816 RepID=A0A8B8KWB0_ABRPR|nr:protein MAIN-LIKE 2-like [Abrus precatorius]